MIPDQVVQDVLARADILEVIGGYVTLKRAGNSFKGLCPFHGEKTPSFHVTPSKGLYYCFGCSAGGTALDFVMRIEGIAFPDAIEQLGRRYGIDVPRGGEDQEVFQRKRRQRDALLGVLKDAAAFFRDAIRAPRHAFAREYLDGRGIEPTARDVFQLGYAPESWDALLNHLRQLGHTVETAERAGLLVPRDAEAGRAPGHYDRFRHRLMFPVIDANGQIIAFGGRTLAADVGAKYINSPETPLYKKGHCLYGIHAAKDAARATKQMILVEGNVDVIRMYQAGFQATVAPMGTALTDDQARLIARTVERVVVLFDGDGAGRRAAVRAIGPLQRAEIDARIALLPDGEDPDSFVGVYGADGIKELLEDARPLAQWAVDRECDEVLAMPVDARPSAIQGLAELLGSFAAGVVRRHYVVEAARKLGMEPGDLLKLVQLDGDAATGDAGAERARGATAGPRAQTAEAEVDEIEFELIKILVDHPVRRREFVDSNGLQLVRSPAAVALIQAVDQLDASVDADKTAGNAEGGIDMRIAIDRIDDPATRALGIRAMLHERVIEAHQVDDWYRGAVARLTERWVEDETVRIAHQIEAALEAGDLESMNLLNERYRQLQELRQRTRDDRKINWVSLSGEA